MSARRYTITPVVLAVLFILVTNEVESQRARGGPRRCYQACPSSQCYFRCRLLGFNTGRCIQSPYPCYGFSRGRGILCACYRFVQRQPGPVDDPRPTEDPYFVTDDLVSVTPGTAEAASITPVTTLTPNTTFSNVTSTPDNSTEAFASVSIFRDVSRGLNDTAGGVTSPVIAVSGVTSPAVAVSGVTSPPRSPDGSVSPAVNVISGAPSSPSGTLSGAVSPDGLD